MQILAKTHKVGMCSRASVRQTMCRRQVHISRETSVSSSMKMRMARPSAVHCQTSRVLTRAQPSAGLRTSAESHTVFNHSRLQARTTQQCNRAQRRQFSSSSNLPEKIGFIGLGQMGWHMARNLVMKGHTLTVFDVDRARATKFAEGGKCTIASNPAQVAHEATHVVTMLPSTPHVQEVYQGENGLLSAVQPQSLFIDSSTIDPNGSRALAKAIKELTGNIDFVDAPVSGGVGGAEAGTLTFMVGGTESAFARAKPVLEKMGKNIVYCGPSGNGQVSKICNNMMLGISMIGTAETMNLGVQLGMDPKLLASILNTSSGRSWSSEIYNPCPGVMPTVPSSRGYEGGFGTALMSKDLGLAVSAAKSVKSTVVLGAVADQVYNQLSKTELGTKDFSSVYHWLSTGETQIKKN